MERPVEVSKAIYCVLASFALGVVKTLLNLSYIKEQGIPVLTAIVVIVLITAFASFLLYKIHTGKNWARIVFMVMVVVGFLPFFPEIMAEFGRSPLIGSLSVIQALLQVIAVWLLFFTPGKTWFKPA
ncbi:hypothetical protein GV819_07865 [Pseudomonas sp. Fl5BN2]|uniref:hypothetical protein n=1 Tax=unclassified Pseudomonas TaxID=196821 RepID=UPI0013787437|nr:MULTISPECIES: hypothetical protein [unclassified Pseudomonas]NBF02207.1 hypothetical protein [Pseudomonas sp. Fl5BN2]NBF07854.1 hypothetical protein [Pseudomonas sp. Fl4BN1]